VVKLSCRYAAVFDLFVISTSSARPSSEDWRDLVSLSDLFSTPSLAEIGGLQRALLTEDFFRDVYCAT
jgi:hypothetical protein